MQFGSVFYGFREQSTIIFQKGKKERRPYVSPQYSDPEANKPERIAYYNGNKGGVDCLVKKCAKSTCCRRTPSPIHLTSLS